MIIGTHNTMSYLKPTNWWMRPFNIFAKCQNYTLEDQIAAGVQCFDIRIWFDNENLTWRFAHGAINYGDKSSALDKILTLISNKVKNPHVRVTLEKRYSELNKILFKNMCQFMEEQYRNINFFGGHYKKTWEQLYTFKNNSELEDKLVQYVGSMADDAKWYEKFIPVLYAKRKNKENKFKMNGTKINIFDFYEF
jgi:hypothetical protein